MISLKRGERVGLYYNPQQPHLLQFSCFPGKVIDIAIKAFSVVAILLPREKCNIIFHGIGNSFFDIDVSRSFVKKSVNALFFSIG